MPSQLDVVNFALNELGQATVTNVNDLPLSQLMVNKLNFLFPELLQKTDWNFAIVYKSDSTPLTNNFSPDFLYTFQLPPDYVKMDRFSWQTTGQAFGFYFRIVDGLILTNAKPINYYYVSSNASYANISQLFFQTLSLYLAYRTCDTATNNEQLKVNLFKEYTLKLMDALRYNDMERYVQATPYNDFDRTAYI
jgi:hypothetical protein